MKSRLVFVGLGLCGPDGMTVRAMNALKECDKIYAEFYTSFLIGTTVKELEDAIGKKIKVCTEVAQALNLTNVTTEWTRAENIGEKYHFVVSRAVMPLADLVKIIRKNIAKEQLNALPNGLICLKGGELAHETLPMKNHTLITPLSDYFEEEFFETKSVVYTSL